MSILAQTKDYPTIRRKVVNRLLSGSKLTGKDEEYIFSELKKAEQSNRVGSLTAAACHGLKLPL
ncbi:hypothetical protein JGX64_003041 [Salmonella enterica]|nr:hypothetical protein [Salmonella enterica]